jgi:hypothetical protein
VLSRQQGPHQVNAFGGVQGLLSQLHHSVAKGKLEEGEPAAEASARRKGRQDKPEHGALVWVGQRRCGWWVSGCVGGGSLIVEEVGRLLLASRWQHPPSKCHPQYGCQ